MTTATGPAPSTSSISIRRVDDLRGPAGRLEALLNQSQGQSRGQEREGEDVSAPYSVLLCHPHPLFGGSMHNKVVYHAMKSFQSFHLPVLRFNFRGAGLSEGVHDDGRGEVDDVRAALDWLDRELALPILFAGFSFGASVGLHACCDDRRVKGIAALGLPLRAADREYHYELLTACRQPKLFLSGAKDEFGPATALETLVRTAAPPSQLVLVPGADHFFTGKLEQMQVALETWIRKNYLSPQAP